MTAILGLLPLLISGQQLTLDPPENLVWGEPVGGLQLGYRIFSPNNAPPIFRTWLKNETNRAIVVVARDPNGPPPSPLYEMRSKARDGMKWTVSPPIAKPLNTFGSIWHIRVPARGTAAIQVSQFRYPVPIGTYVFGTRFEAASYVDGAKAAETVPVTLVGPNCIIEVTPDLAARSAGF